MLNKLKEKHTDAALANPDVMLPGEKPFVDPPQYNNIDSDAIIKAALRTKGAAGPSGFDADAWSSFIIFPMGSIVPLGCP